jgi:hypothetical protein
MLYTGSMTPAQMNLLKIVAVGRIMDLKMGLMSIDQMLRDPQLPDQDKAMLSMQRGQISLQLQQVEGAYSAVEKESGIVVGR